MATKRVLQLLRSNAIYADFATAKTAIEALTGHKDGEIVLARYVSGQTTGDNPTNTYESAIGVYGSVTDQTNGTMSKWTVFKSSTEIEAAIQALQDELDNTQTAVFGSDTSSYVAPASGEDGYEILGGQNAPDDLREAVMKLADYVYDTIQALDYSNNYTAASGNDPAEATDKSKVISGISQVDGRVDAVTTGAVDLLLTGYSNDGTTNTGAIGASDTVKTALNKLENATAAGVQISAQTGNQLHRLTGSGVEGLATKLSITKLSASDINALSDSDKANIRDAYKLVDLNGADATAGIGDLIKIYKDSALTDVYLGHVDDEFTTPISGETTITDTYTDELTDVTPGTGEPALVFIYHKEDGNYELVPVELDTFLDESEFGDGLQVNNHVVSVKKDSTSEQVYTAASTAADVLTVSSNGVKVANVQNAINYATDQVLSTTVTASNERGVNGQQSTTPHISITESTDSTTGLHSYAITETDIASEDELDAEVTRAQTAEQAIDAAVGLTKAANAETRSYTSQVAPGSGETASTTVAGDIALLDAHVQALGGAAVKSVTLGAAQNDKAISVDNTDAQNPVIGFNLSTAQDNAVDAAFAGGSASNGNILQVKNDGLYLDSTWDCGVY